MSYTAALLCGLHIFGLPLFGGPNFLKGFPNHLSSWPGLLVLVIQSAVWSKKKKRRPPTLAFISKQ